MPELDEPSFPVAADREVSADQGVNVNAAVAVLAPDLATADESFRVFVEDAPVAIGVSRNGVTVYANRRHVRLMGYRDLSQMLGRPVLEHVAPESRAAIADRIRSRLLGGTSEPEYEFVALRTDGTRFPVHAAVSRVELRDGPADVAFFTDISDRKRAEELAASAEARFGAFVEQANDAVLIVHQDGRILGANHAAETTYGRSRAELAAMTVYDLRAPDARADVLHRLSEVVRAPLVFEASHQRADGTVFPVEVSSRRVETSGEPVLVSIVRDISERHRTEAALRRSERRFRALFESNIIGAVYDDVHGRVMDANDEYLRIIGYTREDLVEGRIRWDTITPPEYLPLVAARVAEARADATGACKPYEKEYLRPDGTRVSVLVGFVLLPPAHEEALALVMDITERKRAEEQLRKLSRVVEQGPVSVVITDVSGRVEYVNPKFTEVSGYTLDELRGETLRVLKSGHTSESEYRDLWRTISSGHVWSGEFQNRRKSGELLWERARISPVRDRNGTITHFVAVKEDVTAQKVAQAELARAREQFLQSQKMEAVGRLAGGIAHDFNNLLTVICGFTDDMLHRVDDRSELHADLQEVMKAGNRAASLTQQLLAFSRQQIVRSVPVDLNALVVEAEKFLRRVVGEDIVLTLSLAKGLRLVMADSGQLHQVIVNLAVNARDAMPEGGELRIETSEVRIASEPDPRYPDTLPGAYVVLSVADTGHGIPLEIQSRVFEPFFTTKEQGKGTGLGLPTVFGIARQLGGNVRLESEPGKGARFEILIPIAAESDSATGSERLEAGPVRGTETILVAEDEPGVRKILERLLKTCGYEVLVAADGYEALALSEAFAGRIHLLLTDVVMPGLSGPALARELQKRRPGVRVIFSTGFTEVSRARMEGLGTAPVLTKPFTAATVAAAVRSVLGPEEPGTQRGGESR
jgi:PAS domain S-box-containing protein